MVDGDPADDHGGGLLPAYAEWLARVETTHQAVSYTCRVRLGDAAAGEAVARRVAEGLLARPKVFRHWGLPFSGRIAVLAEDAIAAAERGELADGRSWGEVRAELARLSAPEQHTVVLVCVEGCTDAELGAALGCDTATAAGRRISVMDRLAVASG